MNEFPEEIIKMHTMNFSEKIIKKQQISQEKKNAFGIYEKTIFKRRIPKY